MARACGAGVDGLGVLPTIGSKELVAWLPTLLGIGPGDVVVVPSVAYPTYEDGARLAGATTVRTDSLTARRPRPPGPAGLGQLARQPDRPGAARRPPAQGGRLGPRARRGGRQRRVLPAAGLGRRAGLGARRRRSAAASYDGVLAVHSLSKRSNLAGYRAGFVAGDPALVAELLKIRKHAGMIVPAPVQAAMVAALGDEAHADEQRERYRARRERLRAAFTGAGFTDRALRGGLYLWLTRDEDCWETVDWLARRGHPGRRRRLLRPGRARHVRVALTESDEHVAAVAARLRG